MLRKDLFTFDLDVESHVTGDKGDPNLTDITRDNTAARDIAARSTITGDTATRSTTTGDYGNIGSGYSGDTKNARDSLANQNESSFGSRSAPLAAISNGDAPGNSNDKDLLDDIFADLVFDTQAGSNELDKLFENITSNPDAMTIDLDKTTEDVFDDGKRPVLEEQHLFQKIFETYSQSQPADRNDRLEEQVLYNLQESFNTASSSPPQTAKHDQLSHSAIKEILGNVQNALAPTLDLLDSCGSKLELLAFLNHTATRYHSMARDNDNFYVYKAKSERMTAYEARCERMCQSIDRQGTQNPREPVLNVFTMPILFNRVLRILSTQLYDGQLALTLFHTLKKNIDLYTVVCNQQTYNEIMKIYWVYMGKASLCEVELVFLEMQNNGFSGDLATFSIVKEILATYHSMRMGKTLYNPGGVPIWCQEDERRAKNLGNKLRALGQTLRKHRFA